MIASSKRYLTAFAATAALAVGLYGCGGGGDGPENRGGTIAPGSKAVASAIDLVANWATTDEDGYRISGEWRRNLAPPGMGPEALSHTHYTGEYASPTISHDDNGQLQYRIGITQRFENVEPLQTSPYAQAHRYINTYEIGQDQELVTTSREEIAGHGLGSEWHVEELTNDYENGGTLTIDVATDVQITDGATDTYQTGTHPAHNISLDDAPPFPAGRDTLTMWIPDGGQLDGSLGSTTGTFSCSDSSGCLFYDNHEPGQFYTDSLGVTFTPDGGATEPVTPFIPGSPVAADYLAFGYWLYEPEDETKTDDYDFGVFASGGDPFEVTNIAGLTGTATYTGSAAGAYYVDKSAESPHHGLFSADVNLAADFGDGTATGRVTGAVSNFDWPEEVAASLPGTVMLTDDHNYLHNSFGVPMGSTNIYDTPYDMNSAPYRGGHVGGYTEADVAGTSWYGEWSSAFFGNGASATDHPTSMAGTFIASDQSTSGLAGSFGAHKQDDQQ